MRGVVARIPLFQDHSRIVALAVVKRKGDPWEPHNSCKSSKVEILQGDLLKKGNKNWRKLEKIVVDEDVLAGETRGSRGRILPLLQLP